MSDYDYDDYLAAAGDRDDWVTDSSDADVCYECLRRAALLDGLCAMCGECA